MARIIYVKKKVFVITEDRFAGDAMRVATGADRGKGEPALGRPRGLARSGCTGAAGRSDAGVRDGTEREGGTERECRTEWECGTERECRTERECGTERGLFWEG
jgi:hypothetical protein